MLEYTPAWFMVGIRPPARLPNRWLHARVPTPDPGYAFRAFQKIGSGLSSTPVTVSRIAAGWKNWPSGT